MVRIFINDIGNLILDDFDSQQGDDQIQQSFC